MEHSFENSDRSVRFVYDGEPIVFQSVDESDHILMTMRSLGTFYERDVLERLRDRLRARGELGAAIDVGAFIGTHSVYFSKCCGCKPVLSFEANPNTFASLVDNIRTNGLDQTVVAVNKALGSRSGSAKLVIGAAGNEGSTSVDFDTEGSIVVSTLDVEVQAKAEILGKIAIMKVDVEGAELEVLTGAVETIRSHRPILCIEIFKVRNLRKLLRILKKERYWIIDCLGITPTYILEPTDAGLVRRLLVHSLWLIREAAPDGGLKWYLKRLGQVLTTGKWDPAQI